MTIKFPDFKKMFDYETNFHLTMNSERLAKLICHYEIFKKVKNVSGDVVECGVFKGTSLARFGLMRKIFGYKKTSKILAFDVFSDVFPTTKYQEGKKDRKDWVKNAGSSSISRKQMSKVFKKQNTKNFELIAGDITKTLPKYIKKNPKLKISLLNIDIDFVESTFCSLEYLYPRVSKGGIILLDNYGAFHGDTTGVDLYFKKIKKKPSIRRFPFAKRPCYIIKK
jgi:hypothetical protein